MVENYLEQAKARAEHGDLLTAKVFALIAVAEELDEMNRTLKALISGEGSIPVSAADGWGD